MNMHHSLNSRRCHAKSRRERPDFECIALLLQGGGALGAYQAGVYEALAEADLHPDWVAGISIGAINAALIAGNPPEARVEKLRSFWETITADPARRLAASRSSMAILRGPGRTTGHATAAACSARRASSRPAWSTRCCNLPERPGRPASMIRRP